MNRNQEKQLDDLARRFCAGRPTKPDPQPVEPEEPPVADQVTLKPRTVLILTILAASLIFLLIAF